MSRDRLTDVQIAAEQPSVRGRVGADRRLRRREDLVVSARPNLDVEIADLDDQLKPLVAHAAPRTTQLLGLDGTPSTYSSPPDRTSTPP
jgi:hypothetical protein